ncbi:MAG TPA: hypothetical protein VI341_09100 [Actinomycetota bacterium]
MTLVRIEHTVLDYGRWKQAFDDDPIGRQRSGVRAYRILRGADDPNDVLIDLELDTIDQARALVDSLRVIWGRVQGALIDEPSVRIVESVESVEY